MNFSDIKQRLGQVWQSGKQEIINELNQMPLSPEIKEQLVKSWESGKQTFLENLETIQREVKEIMNMEPLTTKITMLGTTGTGKTCYMIGMSYFMQNKGINGFTIISQDNDQFRTIKEQWKSMTTKTGSDRWPPGTPPIPTSYVFNFNYGGKTFAKFNWLDYRGAALPDETVAADRKILVDRLLESDCILLCISAEYLALAAIQGDEFQAIEEAEVGVMNGLLTEVAEKAAISKDNPFPVAIVVTKADLLTKFQGKMQGEPVEIAKSFFENTLFVKDHWLTAIIPVTLGQELAENEDSGKIKPEGVHLPVSFGVLCKILKEQRRQKKPGNWKDLIKSFFGQDEEGIDTQIKKLDQELSNIHLYLGDHKIDSIIDLP